MCGCPACAARTPTLADYARQQAAIDQYEQAQARDETRQYPNGRITAAMIKNEVLAVTPKNWGEGANVHDCKTN
jgi:hypothetical protein